MATAVSGREGWLFLGNDTNNSADQFTGNLVLTDDCLDRWLQYTIDIRKKIADDAQHLLVVAPSKESVLSEYYPFEKAKRRPIDQLLEKIGTSTTLFPSTLLQNSEADLPTYPKADSHWTDFGAMLVAQEIGRRFGGSFSGELSSRFSPRRSFSDLGSKMSPPVEEAVHRFGEYSDRRIYDNLIHNHGRIWIYENTEARLKSCVLYGDSFSISLCKWLPRLFQRLTYVHTTNIDWSFYDKERPQYVITEIAERFIPRAPVASGSFDLRPTIANKIFSLDNIIKDKQISAYRDYFGNEPEQITGKGAVGRHMTKFIAWGQDISFNNDMPQPPGNSVPSVDFAYKCGFDGVEIDVQMSRDKELVLMHDFTLDRTTKSTGRVDALTLEELQSVEILGEWLGKTLYVRSLREALSENGDRGYFMLDLRIVSHRSIAAVTRAVSDSGFNPQKLLIIAYSQKDGTWLRKDFPDSIIVLKIPEIPSDGAAEVIKSAEELDGILFNSANDLVLAKMYTEAAHRNGLLSCIYLHHRGLSKQSLCELVKMGADFVTTQNHHYFDDAREVAASPTLVGATEADSTN
ncbi:glycerophosphodiester phosphodiesterase family protein [Methylobacterium sp. V23]|uniref:glycerophosphodiester phosphodiesterase family protein n=1 Tax=Methylobacterium sp. V23 TaxID=2044878 RepID=UPI0015E18B9E|nr:glycerophosphodiester phosphodiesterase family protein [Methylobacterium sp. V23]